MDHRSGGDHPPGIGPDLIFNHYFNMRKMKKIISLSLALLIYTATFSQNVGIGTDDPSKGKLVVRGNVGSVSAIFGDNITGVSIENNYPGIGFNSYYNAGRFAIANGYGGIMGINPVNGDFHIYTSPAAGTTDNPLAVNLRLLINKDGNMGLQGVGVPNMPLSFANTTGNKIALWGSDPSFHYGLGIQGNLMQLYTSWNGADIAFGFGSSTSFTENMRIKGTGNVGIGTNNPAYPVTLQKEGNGFVQKGSSVEIGTATSANAGIIRTYTNHALQFYTGNNPTPGLSLMYNGNVGIGTTTPTVKFEIKNDGFDLMQLTNTNPLAAGEDIFLNFKTGNYYTGSINSIGTGPTTARLSFSTSSNLIERMAITYDGKVGINTITPSGKLEVNGKTVLNPDAGSQTAVVVNGMMKISSAFVYSAPFSGSSITINNPYCDKKPNAILIVTPVQLNQIRPIAIWYNLAQERWQIRSEFAITQGEEFHILVLEN